MRLHLWLGEIMSSTDFLAAKLASLKRNHRTLSIRQLPCKLLIGLNYQLATITLP